MSKKIIVLVDDARIEIDADSWSVLDERLIINKDSERVAEFYGWTGVMLIDATAQASS